jgi:hypothetical protein
MDTPDWDGSRTREPVLADLHDARESLPPGLIAE